MKNENMFQKRQIQVEFHSGGCIRFQIKHHSVEKKTSDSLTLFKQLSEVHTTNEGLSIARTEKEKKERKEKHVTVHV